MATVGAVISLPIAFDAALSRNRALDCRFAIALADNFSYCLDLNEDGTLTFTLGDDTFELHGAITPSGDTAVIVYPAMHPEDEEYCIAVAIKEP